MQVTRVCRSSREMCAPSVLARYVYGKPPKDKDLKEVEGMGFWKAIKGEPSQPGARARLLV